MKYALLSVLTTVAMVCGISSVQAEPLGPTLSRVKETGEIRIGHRLSSAPFSFLDEEGIPRGYSIDLCLEIVEEVKSELGLASLEVRYVQMDTTTRIPLLRNGAIDLACGSVTNNLTRQKEVDFTHIIFVSGVRFLVRSNSSIDQIDALTGKTIGVAPNTTTENVLAEALQRENVQAVVYNQIQDHDEGLVALDANLIDAYATDDILLYGLKNKAENPDDFAVVGDPISYEPYSIMIRHDDSTFRLVANQRLSELFRTREIDEIYGKWFYPLGVPLGTQMENAFELQALPE